MAKFDFKGVIFDCDGVLLDSMKMWETMAPRFVESFGLVPEPNLNNIVFSMSMEQGTEYICNKYPINVTPEEALQMLHRDIHDYYCESALAKEGAKELMEMLSAKGIKMNVATSSPNKLVAAALERNGMLKYVNKIFTTSEVGESKHSPLVFNLAAEDMGLTAKDVIVCEDSLYALKTAKAAGFTVIGVYDEYGEADQKGLEESSDLYVEHLGQAIESLS